MKSEKLQREYIYSQRYVVDLKTFPRCLSSACLRNKTKPLQELGPHCQIRGLSFFGLVFLLIPLSRIDLACHRSSDHPASRPLPGAQDSNDADEAEPKKWDQRAQQAAGQVPAHLHLDTLVPRTPPSSYSLPKYRFFRCKEAELQSESALPK